LTYSFRAVGNQEEFHKKEGQLIDFWSVDKNSYEG
jgi:hypothetical protein